MVRISLDIEDRKQAENELRRSEFFLAEGQRLAHMGSWAFNPAGFFDYWSRELFQIYGLDPQRESPTLEQYLALVHPKDREFMARTVERIVREQSGCDLTKRIVRPNGNIRYVRCVGVPVFDHGAFKHIVGTAIDVTEQEHMTQKLRRRKAYLAEAQRLSHTGSFGWSIHSGELFWSEETFHIFEYDRATKPTVEMVLERVHPEDVTLVKQTFERASQDAQDFDIEHRLLMPDGSVKYLHVVAHAVSDESGAVEFVGAVMDVTGRKRVEEAARTVKARFEGILKIAQDAIISIDSNQRIMLFNQGAEKVFGYTQAEVVGGPLDLLLPQRFEDAHRKHIEGFGQSPDVARTMGQRRQVSGRRKDGSEFPAEASISKLGLGGELVFTVILRDITDRKRAESRLNTQYAITRILSESTSIDEATPRIVQSICECLDWKVGEIWRVDGETRLSTLVKAWHFPLGDSGEFASASLRFTFPPGVGLPGRVCESRKPLWIRNLAEDCNFLRISLATKADLHCGFGFPILLGEETLGAMLFFSREVREPDHDVLEMMANIGSQIGQFFERRRAEERIRQDERELQQLIDFVPQHILVARPDGTCLYANQGMLEYHGMTVEDVQAEDFYARVLHPNDLPRVLDERQSAISDGASWEAEARLLRKDRQYRWFLIRSNVLRDEQGGIIRRYTTATDIEGRKQEEEKVQRENVALREEIDKASMFEEIVGSSEALRKILLQIAKVASTDSTVLILGETGTGKELVARAIHRRSNRSTRAFIRVNCAAIPPALIASELFGHEKGAFTGAFQRHLGRFESADGGTIFLDEVGELPLETQLALLRVLQEREFERVGGSESISVNVRVLAAANRNLSTAVAAGAFREDLFYRLNVFPIHVPPLRDRREDIPLLVRYFANKYARRMGKQIESIPNETMDALSRYSWPGNIRELQNLMERAALLSTGPSLRVPLAEILTDSGLSAACGGNALEQAEREQILRALRESNWVVGGASGAAARLGLKRTSLAYKMQRLGISRPSQ